MAEDVPLEGLSDPDVLSLAARLGRVLVGHDVNTMPGHFREFVRRKNSLGLVLIPQSLNIGAAIDSLALIVEACIPNDLSNQICLIPSLVVYGL
jgi:hypothetical protein